MEPIYLADWKGSDIRQLERDFGEYGDPISLDGVEVLLAFYEVDGYEGSAFVLLEKDGKLQEVNASHCSCYGLEGQWDPCDTTVQEIRHRTDKGTLGEFHYGTCFADDLRRVLDELESRQ